MDLFILILFLKAIILLNEININNKYYIYHKHMT
jgi:hypothetical protein